MDKETIAMMGFFGTAIAVGIGLECRESYEMFQSQDSSLTRQALTYIFDVAGGTIKGALVGVTLPLIRYVPSLFQRKIHDEDEITPEGDLENTVEQV